MRRHTLVELMMVVAVLSVLASIAIPIGQRWKVRATMAEARVNYPAIWDALVLYGNDDGADGVRTNVGYAYDTRPQGLFSVGRSAEPWDNTLTATDKSFDTIGWRPDGNVRCSYGVVFCRVANPPGISSCPAGFGRVTGSCDVDGDGDIEMFIGVTDRVNGVYRVYSMGQCMTTSGTSGYWYNGAQSSGGPWVMSKTLIAPPFPDLTKSDFKSGTLSCQEAL